jgi:hypothetical protein
MYRNSTIEVDKLYGIYGLINKNYTIDIDHNLTLSEHGKTQ